MKSNKIQFSRVDINQLKLIDRNFKCEYTQDKNLIIGIPTYTDKEKKCVKRKHKIYCCLVDVIF